MQNIWAIKERISTGSSYLHWLYGLYCFNQLDIIIDWLLGILCETCRLSGSIGGVWGWIGGMELGLKADETCGVPPIWLATRRTTSEDALGISLMPRVEWIVGSSPLEFEFVSLEHTADAGRVMGTPAPNEPSTNWMPAALAEVRLAGLWVEFVARASPCMRRDAAAK
ncbi:hypothetical protein F0562_034153 [Nyssa sinensis]|uniref:Uncharacterized protein n=1 Tax=Nyssa sinensis TaxID=561372 RepID=A0A5J5AJS8_9ASTE|nr:hypothetical protein F0562_034153 [Nyssa sinensis]